MEKLEKVVKVGVIGIFNVEYWKWFKEYIKSNIEVVSDFNETASNNNEVSGIDLQQIRIFV